MRLVANNDALIFLNPATDPYSNGQTGTGGAWHNELQNTLNSVIGINGYDIGHLFGASGGGGNAGCIGCVCNPDKGRGFTSPASGSASGDTFDVDYVAHEMGHQFGGNHTFTHSNEQTIAQMEPGSGSTIMGYAGITGPRTDIQSNSNSYFHAISIEQITNNIKTKTCPLVTNTGNVAPAAYAGLDYIIPKATPFVLDGNPNLPNNSSLTYCWEQMDLGNPSLTIPNQTHTNGPAFRSVLPSKSSKRYFPKIATVLSGAIATKWEVLPTVARNMNFRMTVRDNKAGGSSNNSDDMLVTVSGSAGPFAITAPNTPVTYEGGSTQDITWDVAGTTANGVNCGFVDILWSKDDGKTFVTLLAATPNDGTEPVKMPNIFGNKNRIMIKGHEHIFFDVSNTNFTITNKKNIPKLINPAAGAKVAVPVNFNWSTIVSGASCRIQVSRVNSGWTPTNGFTNSNNVTANLVVNYSSAGLLNYTWPNASTSITNQPVAGETYYWSVRSYSEATGNSNYAPVRSFTIFPKPIVISFTPKDGEVGDSIVINGANFIGATQVIFANNKKVNKPRFKVLDNIRIKVKVPVGAKTGLVMVKANNNIGISAIKFYVGLPNPTSVVPESGFPPSRLRPIGTPMTIYGTNFEGVTKVHFEGTPDVFTTNFVINAAFTEIYTTVPAGAPLGKIKMYLTR